MHFLFQADAVIVADLYDFDHLRALCIPPVADSFGWEPITLLSAAGWQLIVSPKVNGENSTDPTSAVHLRTS